MTETLDRELTTAAAVLVLPAGNLEALVVRAKHRSRRRRQVIGTILTLVVVATSAGGATLIRHDGRSRPVGPAAPTDRQGRTPSTPAVPPVVEDGDARAASEQSTTVSWPVPPVTVAGSPLATRLSAALTAALGPEWQVAKAIDIAAGDARASLVDVRTADGQYLSIHLDNVATPATKTRTARGHPAAIELLPNGDAVVRATDIPGSLAVLVHPDGRRVIVDQTFSHKTMSPSSLIERLLQIADSVER